jgi:cyclophilin family peptidyl-prolyl cis-trans isomerase/HEAT repeat protein
MGLRDFRLTQDRGSCRSRTRSACNSTALVLLAALNSTALAQDEAVVNQLANVLAAQDAREFDVAVFTQAANYSDPLVRSQAALGMGRIGDTTALPLLLDLLNDEDSVVQEDAAFALGLLGMASALPPLRERALQALASMQPSDAVEAVTGIATIGGADAATTIEDLIRQSLSAIQSGEARPQTLRALGEAWRLGPEAPVATLIQVGETGDDEVRRLAVYALARLRAPEAGGLLLAATGDDDPEVRAWAARALTAAYADTAGLGRGAVAPAVARLAEDSVVGVRVHALRTLASYGDSSLAGAALDRLSDPETAVRIEALSALGALGTRAAREPLIDAVGERLLAVRRQAMLSLARIDRAEALREAALAITNADPYRRMVGAEALGIILGDTALAWLELLLDDRDGRVVARAFGELNRGDSVWGLEVAPDLARHPDPVVRTLAVSRMAQAPLPSYLDALITAYDLGQDDPIPDAQIAVVRALGGIAELGPMQEFAVEDQFLRRFPTCDDYLVRQAAEDFLPSAAARWGPVFPVETGRDLEDYRDIARRLLVPAARGLEQPGLVIETERGDIEIGLYAGDAPVTVNAMLELTDRGYFNGGIWHRVVPNFVIQDGDPRGDGWGGPGFALRDEVNRRRYVTGTVGMALSGPNTGGSQFFITHAPQPHLDGTYTVIGRVESGMEVVDRIMQGDAIRIVRRR